MEAHYQNPNIYNNRAPKVNNYTNQNSKPNYEPQMDSQNNNVIDDKLNKKMKKHQKKLEKKLKRKMQDEYLKAYGDYLRENGYRVKYRVDLTKVPLAILIVIILIIIGWIIWILPVTHDYLVEVYKENIIIQKIVNIFLNL